VYEIDPRDALKQERAFQIVARARSVTGTGLTSQILAEFASVSLRRLARFRSPPEIRLHVEALSQEFSILPVTPFCVSEAIRAVEVHRLSFWDALIWAVARLNQVPIVLTDDLPGGQTPIDGVRYVNPIDPSFDLDRIGADL
jgi:predicted nucleic acid-binding protein